MKPFNAQTRKNSLSQHVVLILVPFAQKITTEKYTPCVHSLETASLLLASLTGEKTKPTPMTAQYTPQTLKIVKSFYGEGEGRQGCGAPTRLEMVPLLKMSLITPPAPVTCTCHLWQKESLLAAESKVYPNQSGKPIKSAEYKHLYSYRYKYLHKNEYKHLLTNFFCFKIILGYKIFTHSGYEERMGKTRQTFLVDGLKYTLRSHQKGKQSPNIRLSINSVSTRDSFSLPILTNQRLHFNIQKILPRNSITKSYGFGVHHQGGSALVAPGGKLNEFRLESLRSGECLCPGWGRYSIIHEDST
jgi:hypothetical protein